MMTLQQIYQKALEMGMNADPRGKDGIIRALADSRKTFEALPEKEKQYYDQERLNSPYSDTRILHGNPDTEIKKIMAGIDIDDGELLIAKQRGDIDACLSHHPEGIALAGLDEVMHMQADILHQYGVPITIAEKLLHKRISEVTRNLSPGNLYRVQEIAELLDMAFLCTHTVTDNLAYNFIKNLMDKGKPYHVGDVMDVLMTIPEYQQSTKMGFGPRIWTGTKDHRAGVVAIAEFTGGTEGSADIYEKMAAAGVGTILAMHQSEKHKESAEAANINVIVAGHMSSDSLGLNQLLDELEKGGVEVVPCGGLIRVSRN